ncbi:recombination regulator RecX [Methylophilaceae bacterium]|nr:recombination regulator RecX [Methylophilaceae bacterium]
MKMQANDPLKRLKNRALYYLAKREYGFVELINKIKSFATDELNLNLDSCYQIVEELKTKGLQSDYRFCESFVNSKKRKFGLQKISYELKQKEIDDFLIEEFVDALRDEEYESARLVWMKKYTSVPSDLNEKNKQIKFMQNRGFSFDTIKKIIK